VCPCPRWFANNTWHGTFDWDTRQYKPSCPSYDTRIRSYGTQIKYKCPRGFIFDTSALSPQPAESDELTLTCAAMADWFPAITPKCKRKMIHTTFELMCDVTLSAIQCGEPFNVTDDIYARWDWDEDVRNRSYTVEINYSCRLPGWGYPSTGYNNVTSKCLENGEWSVTSVEKCSREMCNVYFKCHARRDLQCCPARILLPRCPAEGGAGTAPSRPDTSVLRAWPFRAGTSSPRPSAPRSRSGVRCSWKLAKVWKR